MIATLSHWLKRLFLILAGLIILVNTVILISGDWYIYSAVAKTYLNGQSGPGIYDLALFPRDTIRSPHPKPAFVSQKSIRLNASQRSRLEQYVSTGFIVIQDDTILHESYFMDHGPETVSNSFSVAKSITALLIAHAIYNGVIPSWDTQVSAYIKDDLPPDVAALSFRQLLSMSSGLNWSESGKNPFSDNAEAYYGKDLQALLRSKEVVSTPGKVFDYMSGNTALAGWAFERVTGQSLARYAQTHLWSVIGASQQAYWSTDPRGTTKAYCCFYSTVRDFARIGKLMLHRGIWNDSVWVAPEYIGEMFEAADLERPNGTRNNVYGMGFWLADYRDHRVIYARGILGQYIVVVPERDIIIVRVGHHRGDKNEQLHPVDLFDYLDIAFEMATE